MTEKQCGRTFPGLFSEIENAVEKGPFELKRGLDDYSGSVQGRIKDGKVSRSMGCLREALRFILWLLTNDLILVVYHNRCAR